MLIASLCCKCFYFFYFLFLFLPLPIAISTLARKNDMVFVLLNFMIEGFTFLFCILVAAENPHGSRE